MSLSNNSHYNFQTDVPKALSFMTSHSIDMFSVGDMIRSTNLNDNYVKVYLNYPSKGIVAHKPICPDKPNMTSGIGDASDNGFWIGMLNKDQVIAQFGSIQKFVDQLGNLFSLKNNSLCKRCNP